MNEYNEYSELFETLQTVTKEIRAVFDRYDLNQKQAACVTACVLNQMTDLKDSFPKTATVSLTSALNLRGN